MTDWWVYLGVAVVMLLLGTVFFGAPYVPTRKRDVEALFKIVTKDDVLVDLGSGDGRLVRAAAEKGIRAYGFELSPLLVFISWLNVRSVRKLATIRLRDYWRMELPSDTTVVFVFLAGTYMQKLRTYLRAEATRLERPLTLVSYGFELPGYTPTRKDGALLVYRIKP